MSDTDKALPPQGKLLPDATGLCAWRPVFDSVTVNGDHQKVMLAVRQGDTRIALEMDLDAAEHLIARLQTVVAHFRG